MVRYYLLYTRLSWTIWSTWKRWFQWKKRRQRRTRTLRTKKWGAVLTRWGWTTCPTTNNTEILYKRKVAWSSFDQTGSGANFICLPDEPEFLQYTHGISQYLSYIYGAEYEIFNNNGPLAPLYDHNVPCVVCYVSTRISYLMIPAKTTCTKIWTREYQGYLMSEWSIHKCVSYQSF